MPRKSQRTPDRNAPADLLSQSASAASRKELLGALRLHRAWQPFPQTVLR